VNIHTLSFPDGAVRGQIPEPGVASLLGGGLAVLAAFARAGRFGMARRLEG
jgi:hypothetical protein